MTANASNDLLSTNQYQDLAAYYDHLMLGGYYDYAAQSDALAPLLSDAASVLEIGVGTGLLAEALSNRGFKVTGIDHTEEMLSKARARLGEHAALIQADVITMDLGQLFDAAISNGGVWYGVADDSGFGFCGHIQDRDAVRRSIGAVLRHLKPKAQLILSIQDYHADKIMQLPDNIEYEQIIRSLGNDDIEKTYIMRRDGEVLAHQVLTLSYYAIDLFTSEFAAQGFALAPHQPGNKYLVATRQ